MGIPSDDEQRISGPIFISIGTPAKLQTFLQINSHVSSNDILVDDYNHKRYKQLGFSRFDEELSSVEDGKQINVLKISLAWLI